MERKPGTKNTPPSGDSVHLASRIAALEQLLDVYEKSVLEQTDKLYAEIAEHTRTEEALEKTYNDLKWAQAQVLQQEKMASIGQLSAGIAHEINNPTGYILSNLGTLQKHVNKLLDFIKVQAGAIEALAENADGHETILKGIADAGKSCKLDYITKDIGNLVSESIDGAGRIRDIVLDLKGFSHVSDTHFAMSDINTGITSTLNIVWNELKYKAKVIKEYGDIPLTRCNIGNLNQVFINILINAVHSIEKEGIITIKTWSDDKHINVSISDTGSGIPLENINKVFEPFFTTKEVGKGTGLGLSIAYDIVKKHNGEITVQSAPGKGTVFTVKIPITRE